MISTVIRKSNYKSSKLVEYTNLLHSTKVSIQVVVGAGAECLEPCNYVPSDPRVLTKVDCGYDHGRDVAIVDMYYTSEKDMQSFVQRMRHSLHVLVSEGRLSMCSVEIVGKGVTVL